VCAVELDEVVIVVLIGQTIRTFIRFDLIDLRTAGTYCICLIIIWKCVCGTKYWLMKLNGDCKNSFGSDEDLWI